MRSLAPPTWPQPTEHTTMAMESGDNGGMADGQVCTLCGDTFAEVSRYKAFPMCNTCYDAAHQADMTVARCVAAVAARMLSTCDWSCPHALSFDWLSPSSLWACQCVRGGFQKRQSSPDTSIWLASCTVHGQIAKCLFVCLRHPSCFNK